MKKIAKTTVNATSQIRRAQKIPRKIPERHLQDSAWVQQKQIMLPVIVNTGTNIATPQVNKLQV